MKFAHFRTIVVGFYDTVDLFGGSHDIGQRSVMVHKVDQGSNELAHIGFHEIRSGVDLGGRLGKKSSKDLIESAMLVSNVETRQTVAEQAESTADIYASGFHGL